MFALYEVLLYLVLIALLPYFVCRAKYRANAPARFGFYASAPAAHDIWIHAVSVGETIAARPIVDEILRRRPSTTIVFTTTTVTGQAQAQRLFTESTVTFFPFDFSWTVKRFLAHHQPRVFATLETEIWPNVTRLARAHGLRLVLANGRISDRSFPRYRMFRLLVAPLLRQYDRVLAREETDRERLLALGAPPAAVETSGNVKFDSVPEVRPLEIASRLDSLIAGRQVFVLGSTVAGEDELLVPELARFIRDERAFVVIAPRKPERFDAVAALLASHGVRFVRRSAWTDAPADALLLDTFGELSAIYGYATAAFVGGSMVATGGHNPIEPAAAGVPVSFGPFMSNFRDIAEAFLRGGGAEQTRTAADVVAFASRMFHDDGARQTMASRARATVEQNRGAAARVAACIIELLP